MNEQKGEGHEAAAGGNILSLQNDLFDSPGQRKRRNSPENFTQGTVHTSSMGGSPPEDLGQRGPRASTAHGGRLSTDNLKL